MTRHKNRTDRDEFVKAVQEISTLIEFTPEWVFQRVRNLSGEERHVHLERAMSNLQAAKEAIEAARVAT